MMSTRARRNCIRHLSMQGDITSGKQDSWVADALLSSMTLEPLIHPVCICMPSSALTGSPISCPPKRNKQAGFKLDHRPCCKGLLAWTIFIKSRLARLCTLTRRYFCCRSWMMR